MLDFVGTIVTAALMVFVVTALLVSMEISRSAKLTVAGLLGLWIGLAAARGGAGWLAIAKPFPVMGIFVSAPLLAAAVAAALPALSPAMVRLPFALVVRPTCGPRSSVP